MITRRVLHLLVTAVAAAALAPSASATLLAPGNSIPGATAIAVSAGGTVLNSAGGLFTTPGGDTGTYTTEVVTGDIGNTLGGLTFLYQFTNTSTGDHSTDALPRLTGFNFASHFQTDVGWQLTGPPPADTAEPTDVAPVSVDRFGNTVGFNFDSLMTPGHTSALLIIHTNAHSYVGGIHVGVTDGGTANLAGFAPVVPEASTVVGFGMLLGLGGLAMLRLRRRAAIAAAA